PLYDYLFFFFNPPSTTEIYTLSLHDALPISMHLPHQSHMLHRSLADQGHIDQRCSFQQCLQSPMGCIDPSATRRTSTHALRCRRSEEHTSELQSPCNLVCRLLLEKKNKKNII